MKHLKTYEILSDYYKKINNTVEDKLYNAIAKFDDINKIKKLIDKVSDIDYKRNYDGITFLMCAVINNNMEAFDLLNKAGADWNVEDMDGWHFLEMIEPIYAKKIIDKYPEEYKLYLAKIDASKYNL